MYVRYAGSWRPVVEGLLVNVSTTLVTGECFVTVGSGAPLTCIASTTSVTASATGGSGNYSYQWLYVSGTPGIESNPTGATTNFVRSASVVYGGNVVEGVHRCRVTDNVTGLVGYSPNVTVRTIHTAVG